MRVLLTGAAGFIGSVTAASLAGRGHEVVGVDVLLPLAHRAGAPTPPGIVVRDVRDAADWGHLLRGVEVVCHLAAMVGAGVSPADLPLYAAHNDLGTASLLAAMHAAGVRRLVQASSMVVYGEGRYACATHGPQPARPRDPDALARGRFDHDCPWCSRPLQWLAVEEDAPLDPRSAYAASKVAQEHYAAAWARQSGSVAVSLRYHNVYGPGMPRDTSYAGVAAIFRSALEAGRAPSVFEDGAQLRDFVHVSDVAAANVAALEEVGDRAPGGGHTAYNICSGEPVSLLGVAQRITAGLAPGLRPVVTGEYRPGDVRHVVASPARARAELGFSASVHPDEGLARFATDPLRG
jgi:dTDP-L-rhamnose 4-epimerase